ncbi:baculoviral IAP repeat-containing protein 2-like isoform X1 [Haliotis rubra]|uniref:baculoviral IAP repeat-containing protein 2-like isoform X1 n=1 Tax=Haliotis rubra TaxID=36100 RepID=UPI001EE55518|nr:baculoviral IAP repeat-containing protein 2-like isoform X1 [Haliotis rubra]
MTEVISVSCEIYPRCIYASPGASGHISCFTNDERSMAGASHMKSEINRLNSFKYWPAWAPQSPATLAKAGLYYTGTGDRVECPFCFGILKKWQFGDVPLQEHRTHFPYCNFVQGNDVGNVAIDDHSREKTWSVLPRATLQTEDDCDYTREATRLDSFSRWPPNVTQTPETLARAGFYHIPCKEKPDRVKCAYCRGKLYNWASGDDPWIEHAKCFPTCPYIRLCFGNTTADQQSNPNKRNENQRETVHELNSSEAEVNTTDDEVTKLMQSDAVQAVLQMGFTSSLVRTALHKWYTGRNCDSVSAQELAIFVLEMAEEGTGLASNNVNDTGSTTPNRRGTSHEVTMSNSASDRNQISGRTLWDMTQTVDPLRTARDRNAPIRERHLCKVCMENQLRVTFIPCGHLACCGPCSMAMSDCPICQTPITSCVRSYF